MWHMEPWKHSMESTLLSQNENLIWKSTVEAGKMPGATLPENLHLIPSVLVVANNCLSLQF